MSTTTTGDVEFTVRRLDVQVSSVRGFQRDYEQAVPDYPSAEVERLVRSRAPWEEMLELDRKLAALLDALGVEVPPSLRENRSGPGRG
jgi:hypothetical protein